MSLAQTEPKLLVEAARDHFKSSFFSYGYPLWRVQKVKGKEPPIGIALFSYAEGQSAENLKRIRQTIESNAHLKWLLPQSKSSVWDSSNLDTSNGCWIKSYGFGSAFRGRHPDVIIVDDPCKDHGTMSIEQQVQFFSSVIIPAAKGKSQLIVTGNPVDKLDFLEWLERNKVFKKYYYPVMNDKGEPLCPEHYPISIIEDKRAGMAAHYFAREYMLKRVSSADARFKEEWIHFYKDADILGVPLYKIMTIDPAISPGGDSMAAVVTGTDASGITYVLDRMSFRGAFEDGISFLCDMMERNQPDRLGIETFAFQKMYQVWLEKEMKERGISIGVEEVGKDSKKTKAMRIEALQPALQQGRLRFKEDQRQIVDQFLLWDPLSKTNEDDEIDALGWQVSMWRGPLDDSPVRDERPKAGTFAEAMESIGRIDNNYLSRLFSDLPTNG